MKINFNICFWEFKDFENRLRNTKFSWEMMKEFIEFCKTKGLDFNCYLFDFSKNKNFNDCIHLPLSEISYERSKKLNLAIEWNFINDKPEYVCFLDADVFFLKSEYEGIISQILELNSNEFITSDVYDFPNNESVNFEKNLLIDIPQTTIRHIPGLGAFFLVDMNTLMETGAFDERFIVWGGEDDDLRMRLEKKGLYRKSLKSTLYHLYHPTLIEHANIENNHIKQEQLKCWSDPNINRDTILKKYNINLIKPIDLLTTKRFDICAKILYAKYKKMNINSTFAKDLYLKHIELWNGFFEAEPLKKSPSDFLNQFNILLESIELDGFKDVDTNYIPTKNSSPYNGAHRVAACIINNIEIPIKEDTRNGCEVADYNYFKYNLNLDEVYLDEMVLEYVRNKKNTFTISIFSSDKKDKNTIDSIISEYSDILCSKEVELTEIGKKNYIISLYLGENWLGNYSDGFNGSYGKYSGCFNNSNKMRVYVVNTDSIDKLIECKKRIRQVFNEGNHSVHINDTNEETWRICSTIFNKNSLNYLNNYNRPSFVNFNLCLNEIKEFLKNKDTENFCVTSSAVLSLYSLRDCNDFDFITNDQNFIQFKSNRVSSHESEIEFYESKDDIIYNPNYHFYFDGIKFSTINSVFNFKSKRGEDKDIIDCDLINKILKIK